MDRRRLHPLREVRLAAAGLLYAKGSPWGRIAVYLYLDTNGILGLPLAVTASIVVAYIFFGQALQAVGGDKFLSDLALVAMGRYRGGAAKMSVVSSSLYGMVSGSAVANVVVDGAITIPMMKRAGLPAHVRRPSRRCPPTAARSCRR